MKANLAVHRRGGFSSDREQQHGKPTLAQDHSRQAAIACSGRASHAPAARTGNHRRAPSRSSHDGFARTGTAQIGQLAWQNGAAAIYPAVSTSRIGRPQPSWVTGAAKPPVPLSADTAAASVPSVQAASQSSTGISNGDYANGHVHELPQLSLSSSRTGRVIPNQSPVTAQHEAALERFQSSAQHSSPVPVMPFSGAGTHRQVRVTTAASVTDQACIVCSRQLEAHRSECRSAIVRCPSATAAERPAMSLPDFLAVLLPPEKPPAAQFSSKKAHQVHESKGHKLAEPHDGERELLLLQGGEVRRGSDVASKQRSTAESRTHEEASGKLHCSATEFTAAEQSPGVQSTASLKPVLAMLLPAQEPQRSDADSQDRRRGASDILADMLFSLQVSAPAPDQAPRAASMALSARSRGLPAYDPIRLAQNANKQDHKSMKTV